MGRKPVKDKSERQRKQEEKSSSKPNKKKQQTDSTEHKSNKDESKPSKKATSSIESKATSSIESKTTSSIESKTTGSGKATSSIENELTSSIKKSKKKKKDSQLQEENVDLFPEALMNKRFSNYHVFVFQGMTKNGNPSHKYWAIKLQGFALITVYGSMSKMNMRSTTREFPSNAQQELVRKINEKQKKGYRYVVNEVSLHSKGSDKNDDSFDNL